MGITIGSKKHSCDMGYGGFLRFRKLVASKVGDKFSEHYTKLDNAPVFGNRNKYFEEYDAETNRLVEQGDITIEVANILYQSDCGGEIDCVQATQIYELIKDCDDNIAFGYIGREDCAKMVDMKKIFGNKTKVKWD
jgi:hypothetical protein